MTHMYTIYSHVHTNGTYINIIYNIFFMPIYNYVCIIIINAYYIIYNYIYVYERLVIQLHTVFLIYMLLEIICLTIRTYTYISYTCVYVCTKRDKRTIDSKYIKIIVVMNVCHTHIYIQRKLKTDGFYLIIIIFKIIFLFCILNMSYSK